MAFASCDPCGCAIEQCECEERRTESAPVETQTTKASLVGKRVNLYKGSADILEYSATADRYRVDWYHPEERLPQRNVWIDPGMLQP
jgi:hypothetical protein